MATERMEYPHHIPKGTLFDRQRLDGLHCFLCGTPLTTANRSDEHVIPQWLQRRYQLWDEQLTLPNDTTIAYSALKIPCCVPCNTGPLSLLENEIKTALDRGVDAFKQLPHHRLFEWCCKILYGLIFKDTKLLLDRSAPGLGPIVTEEMAKEEHTLHIFLQSLLDDFQFLGFRPYSIFVVEVAQLRSDGLDFDLMDFNLLGTPEQGIKAVAVFSIRMSDVGLICVLDDGAQKQCCQHTYDRFADLPLHPLQFIELTCRAACQEFARIPQSSYVSWADREPRSSCVTEQAMRSISTPIFGEVDNSLYCQLFLERGRPFLTGQFRKDLEEVVRSGTKLLNPTVLADEQGRRVSLDAKGVRRVAIYLPDSCLTYRRCTQFP